MKTANDKSSTQTMDRRRFLITSSSAALGAASFAGLGAESARSWKGAIIGHTGRGDYGHGLESIFSNRPNIQVVALADPDPGGRARTAAKIGAARQYADYREMLEKERPNLISIAMRQADQHHQIALAALQAGAHIYCEKPFTTSSIEADELLAQAGQRGLKIAVAHTMRMTPEAVRLRHAVAKDFWANWSSFARSGNRIRGRAVKT
jgi:predicted dehydrogenase